LPILVVLAIGALIYIPFMGAVRETTFYKQTSVSKPVERAAAIVRSAYDVQGFKYRVSTLGREIYACSDAFLFSPVNLNSDPTGYRDLSLRRVIALLLPKIFHGYAVEKFDGSRIAQELMNVEFNSTWFPCISTAGDLYRRSLDIGLVGGGFVLSLVLLVADGSWKWLVQTRITWGSLILVILPLSFVQSFPFGTVQETIWIWGWDLPKYVAVAIVLMGIQNLRSRLNH